MSSRIRNRNFTKYSLFRCFENYANHCRWSNWAFESDIETIMIVFCRCIYLDSKIQDHYKRRHYGRDSAKSSESRVNLLQESQFTNVFEIRHDFFWEKLDRWRRLRIIWFWFQRERFIRRERFFWWEFLSDSQYDLKLLEHHSNSSSTRLDVHNSLLFDVDFENFTDIENFINASFAAINRSDWFVETFSASNTSYRYDQTSDEIERIRVSSRRVNSYFDRKIVRFSIRANISDITLEKWINSINMKLNSLVSFKEARHKVLCLLYHYRHLNDIDFTNLSFIDLITHKVTLKFDTKSINNEKQRRWSTHTEWWMRKIVIDEIKDDVYELIESTNEWLSSWNARAVIVDKMKNSTSQDESRVTFDYSKIHEELSKSFLELSSKVHDNLSDLRHKVFFSADLKHVYLIISMHSDVRHYFAFSISDIDQIQSTRVQQESKFADFIMIELVYKAFNSLSSSADSESSLLHSNDSFHLSVLVFYMNDFFDEFQSFDDLYEFLRDYFLSRIEWAKLRLFFKKMYLFENKMKTLRITHCVDDFIKILKDRIKKIAKWFISTNQTDVQAFMRAIEIIWRWIRNYAELIRSLARLTDKVDWRWIDSEQLFFEIIRVKVIIRSAMHEINLNDEIHFYIDSFAYAADMTITQFRLDHPEKIVKMLIMYDSFSLLFSRRKYFTYKKELYALIIFVLSSTTIFANTLISLRLFISITDHLLTFSRRMLMREYTITERISFVDWMLSSNMYLTREIKLRTLYSEFYSLMKIVKKIS